MLPPVHTALLDSLDRHARRRAEGIATLSTLVGPPEQGLAVLTEWIHRRGLSVVVAEADAPDEMVSAWATALARERDLTADAEDFVARTQASAPRRALRFRDKTAHERRVLMEGLKPSPSEPATWELCRSLLESPALTPSGELPPVVGRSIEQEPLAALQSLLALVPAESAPALRVRGGPSDFRALRTVAALCAAAPGLTTVCVLSPETLAEHLRREECRAVAMLREGRLDLPDATPEPPALEPSRAVDPTLARLRQEGTPEPIIALYKEASRAITTGRRDAEVRARSAAERYLQARLHERPSTRGLFEPNALVDLGEGSRPLEVDLLCPKLRLAVELDGHFHFHDADSFRRDRRKDLALQRAGYWVVRFLSDDVVNRLEEILETLDTLIAARRQESSGPEVTHEPR